MIQLEDSKHMQLTSPHHVSGRVIIVAVVLFTFIVIGMFVFVFLKKGEIRAESVVDIQKTTSY